MSQLTEELDRKVIIAWRSWAQLPEFQAGIDWLRHNRKRVSGGTPAELLEAALAWGSYMDALDDVQDKLTDIPKKEENLDEKPLNSP